MRILFCAPGYRRRYSSFFYAFDKVLLNGLVRAGHQLLYFSDRDEADSVFFGWRKFGRWAVQGRFFRAVESFEPDAVFFLQTDLISDAALRRFRAAFPQVKIANIDCDPPLFQPQQKRIERFGEVADLTFVTSGGAILKEVERFAGRTLFVPNPVDEAIMAPQRYDGPKRYDLVYAARGRKRNLEVDELTRELGDLEILRLGGKRPVFGRAYERQICSARAGLSYSLVNSDLYSSDRIAQLFGLGLCVCLPAAVGYQSRLGPDAAIYFEDAEDFGRLLRTALSDGSWQEIARRGREVYFHEFDSLVVANYVVDALFGADASRAERQWIADALAGTI